VTSDADSVTRLIDPKLMRAHVRVGKALRGKIASTLWSDFLVLASGDSAGSGATTVLRPVASQGGGAIVVERGL
jgi:hypothetical protein